MNPILAGIIGGAGVGMTNIAGQLDEQQKRDQAERLARDKMAQEQQYHDALVTIERDKLNQATTPYDALFKMMGQPVPGEDRSKPARSHRDGGQDHRGPAGDAEGAARTGASTCRPAARWRPAWRIGMALAMWSAPRYSSAPGSTIPSSQRSRIFSRPAAIRRPRSRRSRRPRNMRPTSACRRGNKPSNAPCWRASDSAHPMRR